MTAFLADFSLVFSIGGLFFLPLLILALIDKFTVWLWRDDDLVDPWEWPYGR